MRRLLAVLALVAAGIGCGDNPNSPSDSGFIQFRLDANSCGPVLGSSLLTFTFFVDGAQVGTDSLSVGLTSRRFAVSEGSHVASASVTNTTVRWQNLNFFVAEDDTFTYVLLC